MNLRFQQLKHSAGLTLIELAAAMTIASVAAIGLGSGIVSIVGYYQDDWVTKDVRLWGYEAVDYIVEHMATAKKIDVRPPWNGYDGLLLTPKTGPLLNIQGSRADGLTLNTQPLLDFADFPSEGTYRGTGQRVVQLERFTIDPITDYHDDLRGKPYLARLRDSLWVLEMVISVTTKYQGEQSTEYIKFKRILWAKDKYIS
jgi:hypothetical protein